ncbi:MAG: DUF1080 domain-containing protein, partial [Muribaculaceae bacterium]|nr:DUF1080 domain-containing protein [Muribaculaceae bacterium]
MIRTYKRILPLLAMIATGVAAMAAGKSVSGLNAKEFNKYWKIESEGPCKVTFSGDTAEFTAPKGLSVWRKDKMSGRTVIEYDAQVVTEGPDDRLSDLNCFWMASDPTAPDPWKNLDKRGGKFVNSYALQLYYLGYGGNHNSTTRFRRYNGDPRGVDDAEYRPAIIKEYTDADHLLKPGKWYHIKITHDGLRTQYFIDGERIVDFRDPAPLTEGWFAFRTTLSRPRLTNFSYSSQPLQETDVPLSWVGEAPESDVPVTFGVPFDRGAVGRTTSLSLASGSTEFPTESWPLAFWPDGSVKWAAVSGTIPAGSDALTVRIGDAKASKAKKDTGKRLLASDEQDHIILRAGNSTVYIPKVTVPDQNIVNIIDSIVTDGVLTSNGARLVGEVKDTP